MTRLDEDPDGLAGVLLPVLAEWRHGLGGPPDGARLARYLADHPAVRAYVAAQADAAVVAFRDAVAERLNRLIIRTQLDGTNDDRWRSGVSRAVLYVTGEIDTSPILRTTRGDT